MSLFSDASSYKVCLLYEMGHEIVARSCQEEENSESAHVGEKGIWYHLLCNHPEVDILVQICVHSINDANSLQNCIRNDIHCKTQLLNLIKTTQTSLLPTMLNSAELS